MDKTKTKILFWSVSFLSILGVLLFLPAGSLRFWQAWIYLLVFSVLATILAAYLLKNNPKLIESRLPRLPSEAEKKGKQRNTQLLLNILLLTLLITSGLDHRFNLFNVPTNFIIIADIFIALGFLIVFLVFRENSYASANIEIGKEQKVVSTGPYGIVRHPMYAGALLAYIFIPIALGSFWCCALFIPLSAIIILRILEEENFLTEKLSGYREYCRKVRCRLFPLIW
jgi:protein-S-isoprenylcysteine O-methyltransferase Ste14